MKTFITCLIVVFTAQFSSAQVTKYEYPTITNLNFGLNEMLFADENHIYLIGKKEIIEFSDSIQERKINPSINNIALYPESSHLRLCQTFDTVNFKLYKLEISVASVTGSTVKLTCLDLKNPLNSKQFLFGSHLKHLGEYIFYISLNKGKINLLQISSESIQKYEVDSEFTSIKLVSTEKYQQRKIYLFNDLFNNLYMAEIVKNNNNFDFSISKYSHENEYFEALGTESINLENDLLNEDKDLEFRPSFYINHLNNDQVVISFSKSTEKAKDNSAVANMYREHYIYECDLADESYILKKVSDKSIAGLNSSLEVIFQKDKVVYLEKDVIMYDPNPNSISEKNSGVYYYRMEYLFDEDQKMETKLHIDRSDMVLWLDGHYEEDECKSIELPSKNYTPQVVNKLSKSFYSAPNELTTYTFRISIKKTNLGGYGKSTYCGFFYVFKTQLEN